MSILNDFFGEIEKKITSKELKAKRRERKRGVDERRKTAPSNEKDNLWLFSSMFVANKQLLNKAHYITEGE